MIIQDSNSFILYLARNKQQRHDDDDDGDELSSLRGWEIRMWLNDVQVYRALMESFQKRHY